jgi:hypothetical protein
MNWETAILVAFVLVLGSIALVIGLKDAWQVSPGRVPAAVTEP